jgi:hypothetical protein
MAYTEFDGQLDDDELGYIEFNGIWIRKKKADSSVPPNVQPDGIKGAGEAAADFIPGVDQDNALKKHSRVSLMPIQHFLPGV